jgi:hypothetical protein
MAVFLILNSLMPRYASNYEVTQFFAVHGIAVTHVHKEGMVRHLCVNGQPLTLPMPASPDECLRIVRDFVAAQGTERSLPADFED